MQDCDASNFNEYLRGSALKLTSIKGRNRAIYQSIEQKRLEVEKVRSNVDKLNLGKALLD